MKKKEIIRILKKAKLNLSVLLAEHKMQLCLNDYPKAKKRAAIKEIIKLVKSIDSLEVDLKKYQKAV